MENVGRGTRTSQRVFDVLSVLVHSPAVAHAGFQTMGVLANGKLGSNHRPEKQRLFLSLV